MDYTKNPRNHSCMYIRLRGLVLYSKDFILERPLFYHEVVPSKMVASL